MVQNVKILGVDYAVEEVDCVDKYSPKRGEVDNLKCVIKIDKTMPPDAKDQTLMHEIMHAIFDRLGYFELCDDEEKVQGIGMAVHQLFSTQNVFGD